MLKILTLGILTFQCLFGILSAVESENSKKEVSERIQQFTEAVNQGNIQAVSSYFDRNAEITKPVTGEYVEGKDQITLYFQKRLDEMKQRQIKFNFKLDKIYLPESNVAIAQGVAEFIGKDGLLERNARRVEFVKQNGNWYVVSVREIEVPPPPPIYNHLKDLDWLIGIWKDEDENVSITFNTDWDKFKNFLIQHFKMEVYGVEAMEGFQIIGWDPIDNKIRSWVYDSDGGYGTGEWAKVGKSWQANMNYVLSDGKKGSAINIYTKVNDNKYTFSSIDRKIGADDLPAIYPVTVVKEE